MTLARAVVLFKSVDTAPGSNGSTSALTVTTQTNNSSNVMVTCNINGTFVIDENPYFMVLGVAESLNVQGVSTRFGLSQFPNDIGNVCCDLVCS